MRMRIRMFGILMRKHWHSHSNAISKHSMSNVSMSFGQNVLPDAFQMLGCMNIIASPESQFDVLVKPQKPFKGP